MTAPKRKKKAALPSDMTFAEALERFAQVDPKELADALERAKQDEQEVERYVEERERSIGRGVRRATKRFRL